jgi:hypothetical protein
MAEHRSKVEALDAQNVQNKAQLAIEKTAYAEAPARANYHEQEATPAAPPQPPATPAQEEMASFNRYLAKLLSSATIPKEHLAAADAWAATTHTEATPPANPTPAAAPAAPAVDTTAPPEQEVDADGLAARRDKPEKRASVKALPPADTAGRIDAAAALEKAAKEAKRAAQRQPAANEQGEGLPHSEDDGKVAGDNRG